MTGTFTEAEMDWLELASKVSKVVGWALMEALKWIVFPVKQDFMALLNFLASASENCGFASCQMDFGFML